MSDYNNYGTEGNGTNKETWRRQLHLLNLITYGQSMVIQGETLQNPYYVARGCSIILDVIGPLIKEEKVVLTDQYGNTLLDDKKKPVIKRYKGVYTPTYNRYLSALTEINELINVGMNPQITNRSELLSRAFSIGIALKTELLQKVSDYGLDFKEKTDYAEAYRDEE